MLMAKENMCRLKIALNARGWTVQRSKRLLQLWIRENSRSLCSYMVHFKFRNSVTPVAARNCGHGPKCLRFLHRLRT